MYPFPAEVIEAYRHMVTRLIQDGGMRGRLAVVSALRGEGVTFSSLAMATTLSHDFPQSVCYVDLNWWWPAPQMTKLSRSSPGIAGILNEAIELEDGLVKTGFSNLSLLPAGNLDPARRPVVARSTPLKETLARLSDQFDTLILDIPAILSTSDSMALASLGEGCVLVVQQGVSATTSVKRALDNVAHLSMIGVVMNRVRVATPSRLRQWIEVW